MHNMDENMWMLNSSCRPLIFSSPMSFLTRHK